MFNSFTVSFSINILFNGFNYQKIYTNHYLFYTRHGYLTEKASQNKPVKNQDEKKRHLLLWLKLIQFLRTIYFVFSVLLCITIFVQFKCLIDLVLNDSFQYCYKLINFQNYVKFCKNQRLVYTSLKLLFKKLRLFYNFYLIEINKISFQLTGY